MLAGRSFLPASVAGFIAAKRRKSGCLTTASASPFSVRVMLPVESSSSPHNLCNVSLDARFISSSNTLLLE
jgi:hypothetical protein